MARPTADIDPDARPAPNRRSEFDDAPAPLRRSARPRGWRGLFTVESLVSGAKKLAWLSPLTILIWVYAEQQQEIQTPNNSVPVAVTVTSTVPDKYVEFADGSPQQTVNLTLSGPREAIYTVQGDLNRQHGITLDLGTQMGVGAGQQVNVPFAVQASPVFRGKGVTVLSNASPAVLRVNVDAVVDRDAVVAVDPHDVQFTGTFDPSHVRLRGPKAKLDAIERAELSEGVKPGGPLRVHADLTTFQDQLRGSGEHVLPKVPLTLPGQTDAVHILPAVAAATLEVTTANVIQARLSGVPIIVAAPPDTWHDFDISLGDHDDRTIPFVDISGPADKVAEVAPPDGQPATFQATAVLRITSQDFNHDGPGRLQYILPEGVKVVGETGRTTSYVMKHRDVSPGG
jgi:hypothetical protein